MRIEEVSIVVISHAGIRQVNRAVYRVLSKEVKKLQLVIPDSIELQSGLKLIHEQKDPSGPEIIPLQLNGNNPRTYFYPELIQFLNTTMPHVILLENDPVSRLGWALSGWARRNRKKIICQSYENLKRDPISSWFAHRGKGFLKNIFLHGCYHVFSHRIDSLLVVNKDSDLLFKSYKFKEVTQIPLGYDPGIFFPHQELRDKCRHKLNIEKDTVLIAYFGRMVHQKGVHLLIEALRGLAALRWNLLLDHAFDKQDQYATRIQSLIEASHFQDRVSYFEASHFEIADYMRAADIMVAPSLTMLDFKEQYGRAVQEAMACGCVCLVSDSGHLKDLVGDQSLVFPENNVTSIQEKLRHLIQHKEQRKRYSIFLAKRALNQLTVKKQSSQLVQVIKRLFSKFQ